MKRQIKNRNVGLQCWSDHLQMVAQSCEISKQFALHKRGRSPTRSAQSWTRIGSIYAVDCIGLDWVGWLRLRF